MNTEAQSIKIVFIINNKLILHTVSLSFNCKPNHSKNPGSGLSSGIKFSRSKHTSNGIHDQAEC